MPTYLYKAKSGPSKIEEGTMTADSPSAVISNLGARGLFPISVEEVSEEKNKSVAKKRRVGAKDVGFFTRQLADLLEGGLTIYQAMDTLASQTENKNFSIIIADMRDMIKEGNPLSSTMEKYPKVFGSLYINMVRSGEAGGIIDKVLVRLAEFYDKEQQLRSKIRGALMYPLFLGCFGVLTVCVLVTFIVPKLTTVFLDFGQKLPFMTKVLVTISDFLGNWWWVIILFIVSLVLLTKQQYSTPEGKYAMDKFKLKLPLFGRLILIGELSRFTRTLATLLESGVPVLKSLDIVAATMRNEVIRRELINVQTTISKGSSLAKSLTNINYFPLMLTNMISVGEKGGVVERSLSKIADTYDKEIDRITSLFTTMLEPIMIIALGLVIGVIVLSMLLPIFNLNLSIQ